jgi:hypothetical protein
MERIEQLLKQMKANHPSPKPKSDPAT